VAADDVADALADVAVSQPVNGTIELSGPERIRLDDLVRQYLTAIGDTRTVLTEVHAGYFGAELGDESLVPGDSPRLGRTTFTEWLSLTFA
jgi:uncharacterized protein YbjT (DUF2867 family)